MKLNIGAIKSTFLWLFTLVGLVLSLIGGMEFVNYALKTWVFQVNYSDCYYFTKPVDREAVDSQKQCEENQKNQAKREVADSISKPIVGLPILTFFYRRAKNS